MSIELRWLTNACYEINHHGTVIVTDPCLQWTAWPGFTVDDFKDGIDYVAISHLHWDHITELKEIEERFHPQYFTGVMGYSLFCEYLNPNTSLAYPMFPDQCFAMDGFAVKCLYNRHWNVGKTFERQAAETDCAACFKMPPGMEKLQKMGGMDMNNYLFTFVDGLKVLFWGGDVTVSQKTMLKGMNPDIMIAQFSTKNMNDRADLFTAIEPGVVLFHHQDIYDIPERYEPKIKAFSEIYKGRLVSPKHGEWMKF
jgi:L-ascorbate metabolism protein UlaG (beta-lactamase superfamily)